MRVKASMVLSAIALVLVIFAMPAIGDDSKLLETQAQLETLVDRYIASCGAKSEMLNSRSENIRRSAIRSCRIANFCVTSKETLVKEMLKNNIEPKPYKVSQFLNEKYRGVVLAKE